MQHNEKKELSQEEVAAKEYLDSVNQKIQEIDNLIETLPKGLVPEPSPSGTPKDFKGKNVAYIKGLEQQKEIIKSKVADDIQQIIEKSPKDIQLSVMKEYLLWEDPHAFDKDRMDFADGKDSIEITQNKFLKKLIIHQQIERVDPQTKEEMEKTEDKSLFESLFQSSLHYELTDVNIEPIDPGEKMEDVSIEVEDPGDLDKE